MLIAVKKYCISLVVMLGLALMVGQPCRALTSQDNSLNHVMSKIGSTMVNLYPLVLAKRSLSDKELAQMQADINAMSVLFAEAEPYIRQRSGAYQVSYEYIVKYLHDTQQAFAFKEYDYARMRTYSLSEICASCHTQDTELRTLFAGTKREQFDSDLAFAEFNFVTRNYREAERYYDRHLLYHSHKTELEIIKPLQRLITVYAQVFNQPSEGIKRLKKYAGLDDHTPESKKYLLASIAGLEALQKEGVGGVGVSSFYNLQQYVSNIIGSFYSSAPILYSPPEQEVALVWLRGLLYHYLNNGAKQNEVPYILYWLSICDRSIGYNDYFSLADLYLKACIVGYPQHAVAEQCYSAYKNYLTTFFTTAVEPYVPVDMQEELDDLRELLDKYKTPTDKP